jgi:hypothetical protein
MKITFPLFNYTLSIELTTKENSVNPSVAEVGKQILEAVSLTTKTKPIPYHLDIKNWYTPYASDFIVLNSVTKDMVIELEKYLSHLGMNNKAQVFHNEEDHTVRINFASSLFSRDNFTHYLQYIQKHV